MSAVGAAIAEVSARDADGFWERLRTLDAARHKVHSEHESLRRDLDALFAQAPDEEFREAWRRYCHVITELERTSEAIGALRLHGR